jgi:hypothetical protein
LSLQGAALGASPESIELPARTEKWIPGSPLSRRPGMTGRKSALRCVGHPCLLGVGRFPPHALSLFAAEQLDRIVVVDVASYSAFKEP